MKKPIKKVRKPDGIITENTAKISREIMTIIAKNMSSKLYKKSLIKVGFLSSYMNLKPRRSAEIPLDAVQNKEREEKDKKNPDVFEKTSSKILLAAP